MTTEQRECCEKCEALGEKENSLSCRNRGYDCDCHQKPREDVPHVHSGWIPEEEWEARQRVGAEPFDKPQWEEKLCNQVDEIFCTHLLNENALPRAMFIDRIRQLLADEREKVMDGAILAGIKQGRTAALKEVCEVLKGMQEKHGWIPLGKGGDPWNAALDAAINKITE